MDIWDFLDLEVRQDLETHGADSKFWAILLGRDRDIFLAGMAHARNLVVGSIGTCPEFSAQAVADGYWEIYHDDDCGGVITPENVCLKCGMHPDFQSRGARKTGKVRINA